MIGFLPLFIIWRTFKNLCEEFDKTKWKFILSAISIYIFVIIVSAFTTGILFFVLNENYAITKNDEWIINIISTIFGVIAVTIFYYHLKRKWKQEVDLQKDEIEEIGKNYE